ncbi:MAG: hypothetical protein ABSH15_14805 [Verrucomicrobiota bacterium]|jgi:hypothetical protein
MKKKAANKSTPAPKALLFLGVKAKMPEHQKTHPGRGGIAVSLAPLTPDQALAAALRVKPADLKKLEEAEKKNKR